MEHRSPPDHLRIRPGSCRLRLPKLRRVRRRSSFRHLRRPGAQRPSLRRNARHLPAYPHAPPSPPDSRCQPVCLYQEDTDTARFLRSCHHFPKRCSSHRRNPRPRYQTDRQRAILRCCRKGLLHRQTCPGHPPIRAPTTRSRPAPMPWPLESIPGTAPDKHRTALRRYPLQAPSASHPSPFVYGSYRRSAA